MKKLITLIALGLLTAMTFAADLKVSWTQPDAVNIDLYKVFYGVVGTTTTNTVTLLTTQTTLNLNPNRYWIYAVAIVNHTNFVEQPDLTVTNEIVQLTSDKSATVTVRVPNNPKNPRVTLN